MEEQHQSKEDDEGIEEKLIIRCKMNEKSVLCERCWKKVGRRRKVEK
jgi:hypothetical protein